MPRLFLFSALLLLPFLLAAQSGNGQFRSLQDDGFLLIALPTRSRKMAVLRRELARPDLDADTRDNLEATRAQVLADNAYEAQLLRQAFATGYTYGAYRFAPDTVVAAMRDGPAPARLLDENLEPVPAEVPDANGYWVAQFTTRKGLRGLQLRTAALNPVPTRIDDFYRFNSVLSFFRALTQPKASAEQIDAQRMVAKLNRELARRGA